MSIRLRLIFLIIGLFIIVFSLIALAYGLWPLPELHIQATLAPTMFVSP